MNVLEQLAFVTRGLPEPVVIANVHGQVVAANKAARRFYGEFTPNADGTLGWPLQFAVFKNDGRQLCPEDFPLNRAVCGETVVSEPMHLRVSDGKEFIVKVTATPVKDRGEIIGAISTHKIEQVLTQAAS